MAAPSARVLRDDQEISIPARELVPGDVVFLRAGDRVPAEAMLMITLADNRRIAVRPSGTEPKIKYYISAAEPLAEGKTIPPGELGPIKARVSASLDRLWKALQEDARGRASA